MRWLMQLRMRIQILFRRGQAGARLDEELRFHLEQQIAENIAAGMSAEEARYAALRSFGNPALLREQARATWSWTWLELLWRDVCYGMRSLKRSPGFSSIAILVMALGIGANVAMFTVVRSVLLKPLPFKNRIGWSGSLNTPTRSSRSTSLPVECMTSGGSKATASRIWRCSARRSSI